MGLDVVELVLRCEEDFSIALEDHRLERVSTVGDLFELISEQLSLPTAPESQRPAHRLLIPPPAAPEPPPLTPQPGPPATSGRTKRLTRDTVWLRLREIVIDQLQVAPEDVTYSASFVHDLGAD